jgi:hypothetical protein
LNRKAHHGNKDDGIDVSIESLSDLAEKICELCSAFPRLGGEMGWMVVGRSGKGWMVKGCTVNSWMVKGWMVVM